MSGTLFQWLTVIDTSCWLLCFWWMHRISKRQDALLLELREQGTRIEELSKAEHGLVKEMHPKIEKIQRDIGEVTGAASGAHNA